MKAPLSWLKEYVEVKLPAEKLGERLTEIGLGTEKIEKVKEDTVFDFEITPNRPDLLSMIGIAREIAAVENTKIKFPKLYKGLDSIKPTTTLPLKITTDSKINPRFTGIIIDGITVRESPDWLKEKLEKIGQRPINNIVDITNYVMFELGNPIHAFDYDKIEGKVMRVHQANGREEFTSVDGIKYHLPKGSVVISDEKRIIDLCGIKGGENSGTFDTTKTIFLRIPVEVSVLVRKTSLSLGLRSEASSIFERGVNKGGTVDALARAVELILELAGGEIASPLYDIRDQKFDPWSVDLSLERLDKILGIEIPKAEVIEILEKLNLEVKKISEDKLRIIIPTYRNDLQIEEDIIEEVARIYGYNNFPKTLPTGSIPTDKIAYFKDYKTEQKVKELLKAFGFSEVYTYSLVSESDLEGNGIDPDISLRADNPVSRDFEYLRPTLKINLRKAILENKANFKGINLFELGKVYHGKSLDEVKENNNLAGISSNGNYLKIKGVLEKLFEEFDLKDDASDYIQVLDEGIFFEIDYDRFSQKGSAHKKFSPIPKYPPITEDMSFELSEKIRAGEVIAEILDQSPLVKEVSILDKYKNTVTFHIVYQNPKANLTNKEVEVIREKIISALKNKFKISQS